MAIIFSEISHCYKR